MNWTMLTMICGNLIPMMTMNKQHFLDGLSDDGTLAHCCWSFLLRPRWWRWIIELKCRRIVCRVLGHTLEVYSYGTQCTRCDWWLE